MANARAFAAGSFSKPNSAVIDGICCKLDESAGPVKCLARRVDVNCVPELVFSERTAFSWYATQCRDKDDAVYFDQGVSRWPKTCALGLNSWKRRDCWRALPNRWIRVRRWARCSGRRAIGLCCLKI